MPIRAEFIREAVEDLVRYAESGNLALFLRKLLRLEEVGEDAGQPLGGGLTNWRKIVVGDRDWRIIFTMNPDKTGALILVIGDRADAECYEEAERRINRLGGAVTDTASLTAVVFQLSQASRAARRTRRRPR